MKLIAVGVTDAHLLEPGQTTKWNGCVIEVSEVTEKINPEKFGDFIRAKRKEYSEKMKTDKITLLAI